MNISSLERRLEALERLTTSEIDPLEKAMESLIDSDFGILGELMELMRVGAPH